MTGLKKEFLSKRDSTSKKLTKSELLGIMFEYMNDGALITDDKFRIMFINPMVEDLTGYTEKEIIGQHLSIFLARNKRSIFDEVYRFAHQDDNWGKEVIKQCKNFNNEPLFIHIRPVKDSRNEITNYIGVFTDVKNQIKYKTELRLANKIIENTSEGVIVTDNIANILTVNHAFEEVTGYSRHEVIGKNPRILKSGLHPKSFYEKIWATISAGKTWSGEIWNKRKDGSIYPEWSTICPVKENNVITHFVGVFNDVTEKKQSEERLIKLANYDVLTGVANRYMYNRSLKDYIEEANIKNEQMAILILDLDRFKMINDTLGHNIGDHLLQSVTQRLKGCLRNEEIIARLGGDEFALLVSFEKSRDEVSAVAKQILETFKEPFTFHDHEIYISASIGISSFPVDGIDADTLLKKADIAMYQAKENGRNNFSFYCEEKNEISEKHIKLENFLRKAIEREELDVYYQPQLNVKTKEICCLEALLRWDHPELGRVSPAEFIPLAEESDLIIKIGEWVLRKSCSQLKKLHQSGFDHLRMAVNISAMQFQQENFVEVVEQIVKEAKIDPHFLELELTERILMPKASEMNIKLVQLKQLGVMMSIDDFGTGYSSLSYLSRFPIDALKIDQSFIRNIFENHEDASIVRAILTMAHSLNLKVVAEGVENKRHYHHLVKEDCDLVQGYFISRPLSFRDLNVLLATWTPEFID